MSKTTSKTKTPDSRRLSGAVLAHQVGNPMPKHVKSKSAPHSTRKILGPRKRAGSYEYLSKPIADVDELPPTARDERIRAIGKRAYRLGGKDLMHELFWRLDRQGTKVGCRWDGIGGWYR